MVPPKQQVLPGGSCTSFQCTFLFFFFCVAPTILTQVHTSASVGKTLGCKIPGSEVICLKVMGGRDLGPSRQCGYQVESIFGVV